MPSFEDAIARLLPSSEKYKVLNIKSFATESKSPVLHKKGTKPQHSLKVKHYFSLIDHDDIILLGIEINVYIDVFQDHVDHYIFVSKCDTTGCKRPHFKVKHIVEEYLRALVNIDFEEYGEKVRFRMEEEHQKDNDNTKGAENTSDVDTVVSSLVRMAKRVQTDADFFQRLVSLKEYQKPDSSKYRSLEFPKKRNIIISLFTRYADQYLFPESANNKYKHKIDGNKLLSWWIDVIDNAIQDQGWRYKLTIPGADDISTAKFITGREKWELGSIFGYGSDDKAIFQIPLFPDDPKGRFLEHLVVENRYATVSGNQFWQELGFRQEFRIGNVVGIIGCKVENVNLTPENSVSMKMLQMSLKRVKKLLSFMKGEDFSVYSDIQLLVRSKLPDLLSDIEHKDIYVGVRGSQATNHPNGKGLTQTTTSRGSNSSVNTATNDLTSLVKKKKPPAKDAGTSEPTNITNLIKRKKKA